MTLPISTPRLQPAVPPRAYQAPAAPVAGAPAPAPAPAPLAMPAGGLLGFVQEAVRRFDAFDKAFTARLKDLVFAPYRALAGKYGVAHFVRPNAGANEGQPPSAYGLPNYETLSFKAKDGTPLKGWYIPATAPTDKTIVLAHGHGGNMTDVLYRWGPFLHKAGYNVMAFDFRNHGGSGGDKTTMGLAERQDLDAALGQVQAKGGQRIAVMGLSMGGATAINQAADDPRIQAIIADCTFDTISNAVASRVARNTFDLGPFKGLPIPFQDQVTQGVVEASERLTGHTPDSPSGALRAANPVDAIKKLQDRPVFLIHGKDDDETLATNSVNLAKANPKADLWIVPGAKHGESYKTDKETYKAKVLSFLSRALP
ncbi:MAG: alpha/beta hydrolase [Candidatus Sericytochromatia bacterium]